MSINSVELGSTTIEANGELLLDLPGAIVRDLELGRVTLRPIVLPCFPRDNCGSRLYTIKRIEIVEVERYG